MSNYYEMKNWVERCGSAIIHTIDSTIGSIEVNEPLEENFDDFYHYRWFNFLKSVLPKHQLQKVIDQVKKEDYFGYFELIEEVNYEHLESFSFREYQRIPTAFEALIHLAFCLESDIDYLPTIEISKEPGTIRLKERVSYTNAVKKKLLEYNREDIDNLTVRGIKEIHRLIQKYDSDMKVDPQRNGISIPCSQFLSPRDNAFMIMENIIHVRNWNKRLNAFMTDEKAPFNEFLGMIFRPDSMANESLMELSTEYPFPVEEVYKALNFVEVELKKYIENPSEETKYNLAVDIEYLHKRVRSFVQTVEKSIIRIASDVSEIPFLLVTLERLKIRFSVISKDIIRENEKSDNELDKFLKGPRKDFPDYVSRIYSMFLSQKDIVVKTYHVSHSVMEYQWETVFKQKFPSESEEFIQFSQSLGFNILPQEYEKQPIALTVSLLGQLIQYLIDAVADGTPLPETSHMAKITLASDEIPCNKSEKRESKHGITENNNDDKQKNIADKSNQVSKPKLPRNHDVIELCRELNTGKGKTEIDIARKFLENTYKDPEERETKAKSLLRVARRYPHLWKSK